MLKWPVVTAIALVAVFCSWWFSFSRANLVIHGETQAFDSMPGGPERERQIATLRAGEKFVVYACIDDKSYYGYEIRLPNGGAAYVLKGDTEITQKSFVFPPYSQPIVWNCF
ncbi:MAG TPA: hypothetical protein VGH23_05665 [Rhizomicrobium sp.]|jgi:hypothetical protein